jgi:cytidyltransferase-like protein
MCEVLVTGTFNVMHAGHVELLEFASRFGSVTVGVNADSYLHGKYGEDKTVPLMNRAYVLSSCKFVDEVVVFTDNDPSALILQLKPRYFVRGPDYTGVELPEQDALDQVGAQLIIHQTDKIHDASSLVESVPQSAFASVGSRIARTWKNF